MAPTPVPDGAASLPSKSKDWNIAAGGAVQPDEELGIFTTLPTAGAATVSLAVRYARRRRGQVG
jgi:hypothetical protein